MNRQRGFVMLIIYAVMAAVAIGTIYSFISSAIGKIEARGEARQKIVTDRVVAEFLSYRTEAEENAAKARAMVTGLALNYADALQKEKIRYVETTRIVERFVPIRNRALALPGSIASVRFPDPATRVLDDAITAASGSGSPAATIARPAGAPAPDSAAAAAIATVGDVTAWSVNVIEDYAKMREQIVGWNLFYDNLRKQQGEVRGVIRDPRREAMAVLNLQ